ncbi:hypothetical protein OIU84_006867 [Salix udensis]|uniref:Uncharacterized protein n=1 Tax=Salix udensis TaxID=889485 RepID=A0AAD6P302_9ROSI|nr:hypothetical protein OIU84_006867 [Salix udensis]
MERRRYYHFLLPKSEEEQQQKLYGDGPRPLSFDVVEVRKNSGGDHPPETLPLFPWDLKIELPLNQIGGYGPIELSSEQAFDYVLKHWDAGTVSRMISHGEEQIPYCCSRFGVGIQA